MLFRSQGNDFKALVYEFMPNGSLENWLHMDLETNTRQVDIPNLTLVQRISIAIDVACALDYLHHRCPMPIVHCDLKPSNILFDYDMIAHVGDFGLAKFLLGLTNSKESSSIGIRGTIGYTPPGKRGLLYFLIVNICFPIFTMIIFELPKYNVNTLSILNILNDRVWSRK